MDYAIEHARRLMRSVVPSSTIAEGLTPHVLQGIDVCPGIRTRFPGAVYVNGAMLHALQDTDYGRPGHFTALLTYYCAMVVTFRAEAPVVGESGRPVVRASATDGTAIAVELPVLCADVSDDATVADFRFLPTDVPMRLFGMVSPGDEESDPTMCVVHMALCDEDDEFGGTYTRMFWSILVMTKWWWC